MQWPRLSSIGAEPPAGSGSRSSARATALIASVAPTLWPTTRISSGGSSRATVTSRSAKASRRCSRPATRPAVCRSVKCTSRRNQVIRIRCTTCSPSMNSPAPTAAAAVSRSARSAEPMDRIPLATPMPAATASRPKAASTASGKSVAATGGQDSLTMRRPAPSRRYRTTLRMPVDQHPRGRRRPVRPDDIVPLQHLMAGPHRAVRWSRCGSSRRC